MSVDISKLSYKELQALAAQATEALEYKRTEELKIVTDAFAKKLQAAGFEIAEGIEELKNYLPKKTVRKTPATSTASVKFRGPNGEEWSGKGPSEPKWLKALMAEGKKKEDYAV